MEKEEYMQQFNALVKSMTPQHKAALIEFRDSMNIALEAFKRSNLDTTVFEMEVEIVNQRLAELDSSEVV